MNAKPSPLSGSIVFPDKRVELKDQIDQGIKAAREIGSKRLLLEMLLLSSLPADKSESKKLISQMIEDSKKKNNRRALKSLAEHIFPKHAPDLKEQISQMIETARKNQNGSCSSISCHVYFPQYGVRIKRTNF